MASEQVGKEEREGHPGNVRKAEGPASGKTLGRGKCGDSEHPEGEQCGLSEVRDITRLNHEHVSGSLFRLRPPH